MERFISYALQDDVISAIELVCYEDDLINNHQTGVENGLISVNLGCVEEKDKVLFLGSNMEIMIYFLSYLYKPYKIVTSFIDFNQEFYKSKWEEMREILFGYSHTEVPFLNQKLEMLHTTEETFDVIYSGFITKNSEHQVSKSNRFYMELGYECEVFENAILESRSLLRNEGRLIILTKPVWILKFWKLIDELGLQLEYESFKVCTEDSAHSNAFIWLRFTKKAIEFNQELQKRNVLLMMEENQIDRLFAHRNNLQYPYVELSYKNNESYVMLDQNVQYMQYFFSHDTTAKLSELCEGYTACLVTPSIALYAQERNNKVVLFERDNRFRNVNGLKYVKYDLYKGLTQFIKSKYQNKFDVVICDPPFDMKLDQLAKNIKELIKTEKNCKAYVIFPTSRKNVLIQAMRAYNFIFCEEEDKIIIEYAKPPKIVRIHGKGAIQCFKFIQNNDVVQS